MNVCMFHCVTVCVCVNVQTLISYLGQKFFLSFIQFLSIFLLSLSVHEVSAIFCIPERTFVSIHSCLHRRCLQLQVKIEMLSELPTF